MDGFAMADSIKVFFSACQRPCIPTGTVGTFPIKCIELQYSRLHDGYFLDQVMKRKIQNVTSPIIATRLNSMPTFSNETLPET